MPGCVATTWSKEIDLTLSWLLYFWSFVTSPEAAAALAQAPPSIAASELLSAPAALPSRARRKIDDEGDAAPPANETADEIESVDVEPANEASPADDEDWFGDDYPRFHRTLDHYTGKVSRRGDFSTLIAHRNSQGMLRYPARDLLGFDGGGLKVGLGLRYGFLDRLDAGVYRLNGTIEVFDTYEFDIRYQLLRQETQGADLAIRVGFSWFSSPKSNATGALMQLMISRLIRQRVILGGGIAHHSNSSGPTKNTHDSKSSTAVIGLIEARTAEWLSLAAELTWSLAGFHEVKPIVTFGPKIITNRHTFSFVLSNSQYMSTDGLVANTYRTEFRDWVLGFHITREI